MIKFDKEKDHEPDAAWLNREITTYLTGVKFTPEQEVAIKKLLIGVIAGYNHTISRQAPGTRMGLILTPGSKARLLRKLGELTSLVCEDAERETIMWHASEIMPAVISELNYYEPEVKKKKRR